MNNTDGALSFEATISNRQLQRDIADIKNNVRGLVRDVEKESKGIDDTFRNLGRAAAGYFAFTELGQLPKQLINIRGEFQQLETALRTMLGSKVKADELFKSVVRFAATTPFDLKGVADASKQLLAYGFASDEIIEKIRRLGDISSGLNIPLGELAELYGKTRTNGRLFADDLNQYVGRGIPLIKLLADQFQVAESEVRGLVEAGKIGFPEVDKAINKLTNTGGMFAGLMEEQAKSLTGLYSNFEDSVTRAFNSVGESQEGLLADSIRFATTVVDNYQPILDTLTVIVATYGAYKAAVIATAAVQSIAAGSGAVKAWFELATTIRSAKDAQVAFNLATSANPYAIAASALIALITAVSIYSDEATEATRAQERAVAIQEKLNQTRADEASKIQILTKQINDEARSRDQRNTKLKELIAISPEHFNALTLDNFATDKGTEAIEKYTKALEKKLKVQASEEQVVANNKRIRDIETGILDDEFKPGAFERAKLFLEDSGFDEKKFKAETEKRKKAAVKAIKEENKALLDVAAEGQSQRTKPAATVAPKKDVTKVAKEEKEVRIKTFEEEIEEKKTMYALYQRWIDNFGKEAADKQFADLINQNKDYVAFLDSKLAEIKTAENYKGFGTDEAKQVDFVIREKTEATSGPSAIDQYREKLAQTRDEAATLTEYLRTLKDAQDELNGKEPTSLVKDQKKIVAEAILNTRKELKAELTQYLLGVADSEQKRLEIQNHYAELRNLLEEQYNGQKTEGYNQALEQMNADEQRELQEQKERLHEQSKEFKALSKVISETGRDGIKIDLKNQTSELENVRRIFGEASEEYKAQAEKVRQVNKQLVDESVRNFTAWGQSIGILAEALSEIPGSMGKIGSALAGLSSGLSNFAKAAERTKDGKLGMEQYGAAIQGVASLIGIVVSSAKQRKQAEQEYYRSVISQQTEYNLLLNEQIGLQAEANKSIFYTDFDEVIDSNVKKLSDASEQFEKSLDALISGKAKDGQKNGIDWQKVGAGAAAGATVGAVAGGGVFSWAGAAVGAVGGAIAGLLGGLKKKDTFTPLLEAWPGLLDKTKDGVDQFNVGLAQTLINNNLVDDATKATLQTTIDWVEQINEAREAIKGVAQQLVGQLGDELRNNLVQAFRDGTSAADAFGKSVSRIMENLLEQMIFSKVLGPALKELEADMDKSMAEGGDGDWADDLGRFFQKEKALGDVYTQFLEDAQKKGEQYGVKLWERSNMGSAPAQQGVVTGSSQESINILNGTMNAIRITTVQTQVNTDMIEKNTRLALFHLAAININTHELFEIKSEMKAMNRVLSQDILRAIGG